MSSLDRQSRRVCDAFRCPEFTIDTTVDSTAARRVDLRPGKEHE
jgi:hypothetical protein